MLRNKVAQMLKEREWTLTQLHRKTESLSYPTILKWASTKADRNADRMDLRTAHQLAEALECDMVDLYEVE